MFNGSATIDSVDFAITADSRVADLATDLIEIINSTVDIDGAFNFNTDGEASIYASNGSLTSGTFDVSATNFVHDPNRAPPTVFGTISADTINLVTSQDLIVDAHLISTNSLDLVAPGLIDIEDATSGGDLTLTGGSSISGGTLTASGLVTVKAPSDITLNTVNAGSNIDIQSNGGIIAAVGFNCGQVMVRRRRRPHGKSRNAAPCGSTHHLPRPAP